MPEYRVELDAYSGPLDLLLYLVKRHEVDLYDFPIGKLTDQYLTYLRQIERIDIDVAGEFLLMAATLVEIKSRTLLPTLDSDDDEQSSAMSELDPRYELVQQLLAYKAYKDAANELDQRRDQWSLRHAHQPAGTLKRAGNCEPSTADGETVPEALSVEFDLEDANVLDLCAAFSRILDSIGQGPARHDVVDDETPIALHAEDILDRLKRLATADDGDAAGLTLAELFLGRSGRTEMIGVFLALLNLVNQKQVKIVQDRLEGEIRLSLPTSAEQVDLADETVPDWRDPQTGQMVYDWPSIDAKLRAERRAQRRAARSADDEATAADQDEDVETELDDDAAEPA
jgi:segregation and condensation protein A